MGTGDYNLFCHGNKVLKNRDGYDRIFGKIRNCTCVVCGIIGADRYHLRDSAYYCTNCASNKRFTIEERHVP